MTPLQAILISLFCLTVFAFEIGVIVFVAWLIGRAIHRNPKSPDELARARSIAVDPGSSSWSSLTRPQRFRLLLGLFLVAAGISAGGFALYWNAAMPGGPAVFLVLMGLTVFGCIVVGIIFGTKDRDYYI